MPEGEPIRFAVVANRSLRRRGVSGHPVAAELSGATLLLRGGSGGMFSIGADGLARLRFGYIEGKYNRTYMARLWPLGQDDPIRLVPVERPARAYGLAMRRLAGRLEATGRLDRIERGDSAGGAWFIPLGVGLIAAAFAALAWFGPTDQPTAIRFSIPLIVVALMPIFVWRAFKIDVPAPVASLEEIEAWLPPPG